MALARVKTLDAKQRNVLDHPRILRFKMTRFKAPVADNVKERFFAFCQGLAASLSALASACRRGIGAALKESMTPR